jgi:hypothetical protein
LVEGLQLRDAICRSIRGIGRFGRIGISASHQPCIRPNRRRGASGSGEADQDQEDHTQPQRSTA